MAALDFGMALARGMLPQAKEAQEELVFLAGGQNMFKSEDWWNTQVDKQISKGYGKKETGTEYLTKSGEYVLGRRTRQPAQMYDFSGPKYAYNAPRDAVITGYTKPTGNILYGGGIKRPIYETRQVDVFGGAVGTKDFTAGELSDIESAAKRGARQAKRETAQAETAKKRLTRGTGGLAAKARPVGAKATTGLPELGTGGLQLGATSLGKGLLV